MKKMFQVVVFSFLALIVAGALVVPSGHASIAECVKAKVDEGLSRTDAYKACREEAQAECKERMEDLKERIAEELQKQKAFKECMDAWDFDITTVNLEQITAQVDGCAIEAGLTTAEEIAEMEARREEIIAEIEALKAKVEEAIADAKAKKETMDACMQAARENAEDSFGFSELKDAVDTCLLEIGIDVEAEIQKIEDKMAEMKEIRDAVRDCIHEVLADEEMSKDQKKEAIDQCLSAIVDAD